MEFGGIVVSGGAQANAFAAAAAQLLGFTANGEYSSYNRGDQAIIPDFANNRILVEQGVYMVEAMLSFGMAAAAPANFIVSVAKNGIALPEMQCEFSSFNVAGTKLDIAMSGIVLVSPGDVSNLPYAGPALPPSIPTAPAPVAQPPLGIFTLLMRALTGGPQTLTLEYGQFNAYRLSPQ